MGDPSRPAVPWLLRGGTFLILLAVGWGIGSLLRAPKSNAWPPSHKRLRVLTTIFPLYDFTREIGGTDVEVRNLLPPGVDPHEFALSPHDIALVDKADLLVSNGGGLDEFLTAALRKARIQPARRVIVASNGLPWLEAVHENHVGETGDPHLWLDPVNAKSYVRSISDALDSELRQRGDEAAASRVRGRTEAFQAQLAHLDREYREELAPVHGKGFIAFHGAFAYLAARYGLNIAGVWQTTPGREPAPRDVGALLVLARSNSVNALFSEPQFSPRALEMIANDARIPVYSLNPLETAREFDSTHYVPVMRANLKTLVRALGR